MCLNIYFKYDTKVALLREVIQNYDLTYRRKQLIFDHQKMRKKGNIDEQLLRNS